MSNTIEGFSTIVGLLYEASITPEYWPAALESLSSKLNAPKAQMLYIDPEEYMFSFACGYGFDPYAHGVGAGKFRRYLAQDPIALYAIDHQNEVFSDRRVIDSKVLHKSPMQQDIRDPMNMEYMLTVFITDEFGGWTGFCFFRGVESKAFTKEDEEVLEGFLPHLRRATNIHKTISGSTNLNSIQHGILENLDTPLLVLNDLHDIIICNRAAKALINSSKVLRISSGSRLSCMQPRENTLLHQAIDEAISSDKNKPESRKIAVRLNGRKSAESIIAVTTPLQTQKVEVKKQTLSISAEHYSAKIPNRKNVQITLCDTALYKQQPQLILEKLFNLTPSEAALANSLADDISLKESAKLLGRSFGTARVQLQSIFEKTDTNRQSSLLKLIMSIPHC